MSSPLFGKMIHRKPVVSSTNDEAIRRAREGGEEGEVFLADQQTAGRGRLQRPWESPAGKNLYVSFLLRPALTPTDAIPMTLMSATAIVDTLRPLLPGAMQTSLKIKWPNDIFLNGKKIAGILCEMESLENKLQWLVCGIGLNVNALASDFSPEIRHLASSLRIETGKEYDRATLFNQLCLHLETHYHQFLENGPAETISLCERYSYLQGKNVLWQSPQGQVNGVVRGIDVRGALLLHTPEGKRLAITSGDVREV